EHIGARDPLSAAAAFAIVLVLPWQAPLWWMLRRLRLAIELDCDGRVVAQSDRAHAYGLLLLQVGARPGRGLMLSPSLVTRGRSLEQRVRALTALRPSHPVLRTASLVALAALVGTMAAFAPRPTAPSAVRPARP